jgi:chromosome segregation ATPase
MDEVKTPPGFPGDRSQAAAEKLRALRERANQALDDHRRRLSDLESQLSERVQQLAGELGDEVPPAALPPALPDEREAEIAELRRQLEEGRKKHEKFIEQLAAARRQLEELQAQPCPGCEKAAGDVAAAEQQVQLLRQELELATRLHHEEKARHDKFAEQLAHARQALSELQNSSGDRAAELSAELESARAAKDELETSLAAARRDLDILHVEVDGATARNAELEAKLVSAKTEAESAAQSLAARDQLHAADREEIERLTALHAAAEQNLLDARAAAQSVESALTEKVAALEQQAADAARQRDDLARKQGDLMAGKQKLDEALAKLRNTVDAEQIRLADKFAASQKEVAQLNAALNDVRQSADAEQVRLAQKYTESQEEIVRLNAALAALKSESDADKFRLTEGQAAVQSEVAALNARAAAAELEKAAAEQALAQATDAQHQLRGSLESATRELADIQRQAASTAAIQVELDQARAEIAELRLAAGSKDELEQLRQKFDLALGDVQKLKRECSGLREELSQRPEANEQESPELIAVRSERDALVLRVGELEASAAKAVDLAAEHTRDDLQRRFEMAVDDVRQLKQENAQLRDKLQTAAKTAPAGAPAAGGGADWASQRARLMAMLEEEDHDGAVDGERKKERATIESTIQTTDAALAEKEREIAELRAAIADNDDAQDRIEEQNRAKNAILDADDVIAAERRRIRDLEIQWEDKVRGAELEISLERAKLARDQAALKERILELEMNHPQAADAVGPTDSKPRRRWRSALGLGDEVEDGKKKK